MLKSAVSLKYQIIMTRWWADQWGSTVSAKVISMEQNRVVRGPESRIYHVGLKSFKEEKKAFNMLRW